MKLMPVHIIIISNIYYNHFIHHKNVYFMINNIKEVSRYVPLWLPI